MADEPRIPEPRDDDHEEIADKLSIAAAMWARGDRADALSWVRRAAESASDLEQDMRALELAKLASELAGFVEKPSTAVPAAAPVAAAPAAPPARPATAAPAKPQTVAPGKAPAAASSLPKKAPGSRPPGKLPPLPPLRPLGTASASVPAKPVRSPSILTSASGASASSGTITKEERQPPKPMPWDEPMRGDEDDEATHQIALGEAPRPVDMDATVTREIAVIAQQPAREDRLDFAPPAPAPEHLPPSEYEVVPSAELAPVTRRVAELSLAVGVRVRLVQDDHGVHLYPEDERTDGVVAIVVPVNADDDLRMLFQRLT